MKNNMLTLVIGILLGAVIATLGWLLYIKSINMNMTNPQRQQMLDNQFNDKRSEMPQNMEQGGQNPPAIPIT